MIRTTNSIRKARFSLLSVLGVSLLTWACATSPTGRKQLKIVPAAQMDALGVQSFEQMKTQLPVEQDAEVNRYVKCVAMPIASTAGPDAGVKEWEIVVFKDDSANAFALPGGKIGVHTGLLKVAKNEAQLAAVLGHEVGHVLAGHSAERVSENLAAQGGLAALSAFTGSGAKQQLLLGLLGAGAQFGVLLPHSRDQESEADVIGIDLMARAGFDPQQSVELWRNMIREAGGSSPPEFLSTHPASENRIKNLESHMGEAMAKYKGAQASGQRAGCSGG